MLAMSAASAPVWVARVVSAAQNSGSKAMLVRWPERLKLRFSSILRHNSHAHGQTKDFPRLLQCLVKAIDHRCTWVRGNGQMKGISYP
jgi:hypothetical protein